jgi:hypothetical protein
MYNDVSSANSTSNIVCPIFGNANPRTLEDCDLINIVIASAKSKNKKGASEHPCRTDLVILNRRPIPLATNT